MRDNVVIYQSFHEASKLLPPEEYKELWTNLFEYALYDQEPEFNSPLAEAIMIMAIPQIEANKKRYVNGCKGGAPAGNQNAKKQPKQPTVDFEKQPKQLKQPNDNDNDNVNDNDNDNDNNIGAQKTTKRFLPPTKEDIKAYCSENNITIDIEHFIDYYSGQDWKLASGKKMQDWKLAVRNWKRNDEKFRKGKTESRPGQQNMMTQTYNFDELERQLLEASR